LRKISISNRIRELRFEAGEMTQQELADRVGITRQTVIALEQEKYSPSLELAFLIADTFGARIEDVFRHRQVAKVQSRRVIRQGRIT
jgi:putative transcriptional regulator